jgi:endonuclease/exonuclease/phosphatase family metal-dependent hydrolase
MKIRVLTFNLGDSSELTEQEWDELLEDKSWDPLVRKTIKNTIIIVSTQEDVQKQFLLKAIGKRLEETHKIYRTISKSSQLLSKTKLFNIGLLLAVPKNMDHGSEYEQNIVRHGSMGTKLFNTKASLVMEADIDGIALTIVSSHLPVEPKKADMGYSLRAKAAQEIVEHFKKNDRDARVILWMGDMNFRMDGNTDQIRTLLNNKFMESFELVEHTSGPTCKTTFSATEECKRQYLGMDKELTHDCYEIDERVPSYCDRLLYAVMPGIGVTRLSSKALVAPGTEQSDHNPVITNLCICKKRVGMT